MIAAIPFAWMPESMPIMTSFVVSLLVSTLLAKPVLGVLHRVKSRQTISEHVQEHAHKQGTPTMGGLIILAGFFAGAWASQGRLAMVPLLITLAFALIGFVDDFVVPRLMAGKRGLGWKQKLLMEVALTVGIARLGTDNWTMIGGVLFMVLFMSNAYNFSDGLDALAGSLAVLLAIGLAAISMMSGHRGVTPSLMAALVGGLVPFLYFNAPPARVFMGDVGALAIGALLGYTFVEVPVRSVDLNAQLYILPLSLLAVVMVAELLPVPLQIASVKLRKGKRLFPRTPIHHAFQHAGWPETRVVWMFVIVQGVAAVLAIGYVAFLAGVKL